MNFPKGWYFDEQHESFRKRFHIYRDTLFEERDKEFTGITVEWDFGLLKKMSWEDYKIAARLMLEKAGYRVNEVDIKLKENYPVFVFMEESKRSIAYSACIKKGYDVVGITCECLPQEWVKYEPVFKKAIRSFKFR